MSNLVNLSDNVKAMIKFPSLALAPYEACVLGDVTGTP